ncbi:MAG: hypothetical protein U0176_23790 [Bacteroidia bacterium]
MFDPQIIINWSPADRAEFFQCLDRMAQLSPWRISLDEDYKLAHPTVGDSRLTYVRDCTLAATANQDELELSANRVQQISSEMEKFNTLHEVVRRVGAFMQGLVDAKHFVGSKLLVDSRYIHNRVELEAKSGKGGMREVLAGLDAHFARSGSKGNGNESENQSPQPPLPPTSGGPNPPKDGE